MYYSTTLIHSKWQAAVHNNLAEEIASSSMKPIPDGTVITLIFNLHAGMLCCCVGEYELPPNPFT